MPTKIQIKAKTRFGRLTFLREMPMKNNRRKGLFLCDCGNEKSITIHDVRNGHTSSCGCYHTERIRSKRTHGETLGRKNSPEYVSWRAMRCRCYYKKSINYANYGGRGIRVCDRWINDFSAFLQDMGRRPGRNYSIDRINVNGNYEPSNCRWATRKEQRRNTRNIRFVEHCGKRMIIEDWSKLTGVPAESISARLRHGWDPEKALFFPTGLPPKSYRMIEHNGITMNIKDWSRKLNISYGTLYDRIVVQGLSPKQAFVKSINA